MSKERIEEIVDDVAGWHELGVFKPHNIFREYLRTTLLTFEQEVRESDRQKLSDLARRYVKQYPDANFQDFIGLISPVLIRSTAEPEVREEERLKTRD